MIQFLYRKIINPFIYGKFTFFSIDSLNSYKKSTCVDLIINIALVSIEKKSNNFSHYLIIGSNNY